MRKIRATGLAIGSWHSSSGWLQLQIVHQTRTTHMRKIAIIRISEEQEEYNQKLNKPEQTESSHSSQLKVRDW